MTLKKTSLTVLALALALSLSACGAKQDAPQQESTLSVEAGKAGMPTTPPDQAQGGDVEEALKKLSQEENDIMAKNQALWDKVFLNADKNSAMITDGSNYGDFLKKTIESAKDKFTEDELKILNEGADQITEIEKKVEELKKQAPKTQDTTESVPAAQAKGQKFPEFQGQDLDGNPVASDLFQKNAVTVVNFWFSTCNPCIAEMDALEALSKDLKAKGGELIGVNAFTLDYDKDAIKEAKAILEKKGVSYRNIAFPKDSPAGSLVENLMSFPTTIVLDRQGNMIGEPIMGAVAEGKQHDELMKRIQAALDQDGK